MKQKIVHWLSIFIAVLSVVWFVYEPGFEPLIVFLGCVVGFMTTMSASSHPQSRAIVLFEPFDSEFWPGEGIPSFNSQVDNLTLRMLPEHESKPVIHHAVEVDSKIEYRAYRYRTVKSGEVFAKMPIALSVINFGKINYLSKETYYETTPEKVELSISANETFEFLQYRAEGSCIIRKDRYVYAIDFPPWLEFPEKVVLKDSPIAESWLNIECDNQSIGWLLVENGEVVESGRQF